MTSQIFTLQLKTPTSILIYFDDSKYKPQIDRGLFLDLHVSFLLVSLFVLFLSDAPNSFPKPAPPKKTCVYIYTCCFINIYIYYIFPPIHTMRVYRYINLERFCSHEAFKNLHMVLQNLAHIFILMPLNSTCFANLAHDLYS